MGFQGLWVGSESRPDHYRLLRHLGGGSQGQVWEAEEPVSGNSWARVAIKIGGRVNGHDARTRWMQYGGLLRSLHSVPGLVRVVDVFVGPAPHRRGQLADTHEPDGGTADDEPAGPANDEIAVRLRYVVMALVPGDTLAHVLHRNPDLPPRRLLQLLRPVAAALDAMHDDQSSARPVIHGDVKPDNVLLPPNGDAVLVDLGSTRITDDHRPVGRTRHYAAPELHGPSAVTTPATDRFAFAATIAHVLLGQPPPLGPTGPDVAATKQLLLADTAKVPPALTEAVHAVLLAPPTARPAPLLSWLDALITIADSVDQAGSAGFPATTDAASGTGPALAGHAADEPGTAGTTPGAGRADSPHRKNGVPGSPRRRHRNATLAAACLAVATAAGGWWQMHPETPRVSAPEPSDILNEYETQVRPGLGLDLDILPGQSPERHAGALSGTAEYRYLDFYRTRDKEDQVSGVPLPQFNVVQLMPADAAPGDCRKLPTQGGGKVLVVDLQVSYKICVRTHDGRWAMVTVLQLPAHRAAPMRIRVTLLRPS